MNYNYIFLLFQLVWPQPIGSKRYWKTNNSTNIQPSNTGPIAEFLKKIKLDKDLNTLTNEEGLATYIIVSKGDIILYKRPSPSYSFKFNALVFFEKNLTLKVQLFLIFVHWRNLDRAVILLADWPTEIL